jgi:hypothetical protein
MKLELFPIWAGGKAGYLYNVTLDGDLILERSRDPACDLARVLRSRGVTGLVTLHNGKTGKPRIQINKRREGRQALRSRKKQGWHPARNLPGKPPYRRLQPRRARGGSHHTPGGKRGCMSQQLEQAEQRLKQAKSDLARHDRGFPNPLARSRLLLELARSHQTVEALRCTETTKGSEGEG